MSYFLDICLICLKYSKDRIPIKFQNINETSIENKLKYFLPEHDLISDIPKYICGKCEKSLNKFYVFKEKCLQNAASYKKYAQQITTIHGSFKYISFELATDFHQVKMEILDDNNCNASEFQTEIKVETEDNKEFIIEEEFTDKSTGIEEILIREIKEEPSEPNENIIGENVQIPKEHNQTDLNHDVLKFHDEKLNGCEIVSQKVPDTQEKTYTCKICGKSFRLLRYLKSHHLIHNGERPFTCEVCNKTFRVSRDLNRHKLVHTNEKPFTCEICHKSFKVKRDLKSHKLIHTGKKPYACKFCNKLFRRLPQLRQHQFTHTGEKPFVCGVCNKSFRQSSHLKSHRFTHTNEKPHKCEICNASFTTKQNLQKHSKMHSNLKSSESDEKQEKNDKLL